MTAMKRDLTCSRKVAGNPALEIPQLRLDADAYESALVLSLARGARFLVASV